MQDEDQTFGELLEIYRIPQVLPEFKEEPFKRLSSSVLVDLYEYIESLGFNQVPDLLHETYCNKINKEQ